MTLDSGVPMRTWSLRVSSHSTRRASHHARCARGRIKLNPLSTLLQRGVPGSLWARAMFDGMEVHWRAWGNLFHSVSTGQPAFDHLFGMPFFEHLKQHPADAAVFDTFMAEQTAAAVQAVVDAYDFSGFRSLVDVGGGYGALLAGVLRATPDLRGVLFDLPHVVDKARPELERTGVADRCEVVAGDFFAGRLPSGDALLLKQILHDWDDERCLLILRNCRTALAAEGRLLIFEVLVPQGDEPHAGKYLDLEM